MVIISTVVQGRFLQYIVASVTEKGPIVPWVLYRKEARVDSGKVTCNNKRLVWAPSLARVQLTLTQRVSAELTNKCCLGVSSQAILSEHSSS